jgi:hypothetical protein
MTDITNATNTTNGTATATNSDTATGPSNSVTSTAAEMCYWCRKSPRIQGVLSSISCANCAAEERERRLKIGARLATYGTSEEDPEPPSPTASEVNSGGANCEAWLRKQSGN